MACAHWTPFVAASLQGRNVFKDECIRCFHSPKSPEGLDVCLTCLQGSCREQTAQGKTHAQVHFENTRCSAQDMHPIVMNIRMTPKPKDPSEPKEITKLAIGKPGGVDAEVDQYDTHCKVNCLECQNELSIEDPTVKAMCESVLQANSAFTEQKIGEWEAEIVECPHTKNLDQSGAQKIADESIAHCGECDLKSNLWLCMTCGHLGCGRKNYDGSGGNNHAVDHGKNAHHPLVCKLGTITAQGSASIHCYDCDEEVLDKNLAQHLGVLGIDIQSQVKTEKTTTELNLEANLSLTLSKVLEEGKILIPAFGKERTGMVNLGNSCYLNSVIQVLFAVPTFRDYFYERAQPHLDSCKNFTANCYMCQFSKLVLGLVDGHFSKPILAEKSKPEDPDEHYQDGIRPQMFKYLVGKNHEEFKTGQQ